MYILNILTELNICNKVQKNVFSWILNSILNYIKHFENNPGIVFIHMDIDLKP